MKLQLKFKNPMEEGVVDRAEVGKQRSGRCEIKL